MKLNSEVNITPKLLWYPVLNGDKACGDVLVTAELILRDKVPCCFLMRLAFPPIQALVNNSDTVLLT